MNMRLGLKDNMRNCFAVRTPKVPKVPCGLLQRRGMICRSMGSSDGKRQSRTPLDRIKQALVGEDKSKSSSDAAASINSISSTTGGHYSSSSATSAKHSSRSKDPEVETSLEKTSFDGSWSWWTRYFDALDDMVRELEGIDEELDSAISAEDYKKAAELRDQQQVLESSNPLKTAMASLRTALVEERYSDAAVLRDTAGMRLLGWWAGKLGNEDSEGHLIAVTADFGRYIAYAFTGNHIGEIIEKKTDNGNISILGSMDGPGISILDEARAPFAMNNESNFDSNHDAFTKLREFSDPMNAVEDYGVPVFEVFLLDSNENPGAEAYIQQASALHAPSTTFSPNAVMKDLSSFLSSRAEEGSSITVEKGENEDGNGYVTIKVTGEDGGAETLGIEVANVDDFDVDDYLITKGDAADKSKSNDQAKDGNANFDKENDEENHVMNSETQDIEGESRLSDKFSQSSEIAKVSKNFDREDLDFEMETLSSMGIGFVAQRTPAKLQWHSKDEFQITVEDVIQSHESSTHIGHTPQNSSALKREIDIEINDCADEIDSNAKSKQSSLSEMDSESIDSNYETSTSDQYVDEIEDLVRSAMGDAIAKGIGASDAGVDKEGSFDFLGLKGKVQYCRILNHNSTTDPLSGIFVGSFGPHGHEVVQMQRVLIDGEEWVQVQIYSRLLTVQFCMFS